MDGQSEDIDLLIKNNYRKEVLKMKNKIIILVILIIAIIAIITVFFKVNIFTVYST